MPCHGPPARASRFARFRRAEEKSRSRPQKRVMARKRVTARGLAHGRIQKLKQNVKMEHAKNLKQAKNMVCMRPGPVTRNPYLNFIREFRKENCDLSFTEMGAEAGRCWRAMSESERKVYQQMAEKVRPYHNMVCMRPGPVTRNPYLNFIREFRKQNCDLSFTEMGREAGKRWRAMNAQERIVYERQAQSTPKKERRRRSRFRR